MTGKNDILLEITPQVLLKAYACGIFPMAESADDPGMFWVEPEFRGILPLDGIHISRSLKKELKKNRFDIRYDTVFSRVIRECAQETPQRKSTWINRRILDLYCQLHKIGHAHSVEVWYEGELVGGLYGVRLGGAFFGESMFSRMHNASKVALAHLAHTLVTGGFTLLDTQFTTEHLSKFGGVEVPRDRYQIMLEQALLEEGRWPGHDGGATSDSILQSFNQTS